MIRKFKFEDEMHESLQCVPMAVRRKLDRVGLKVGLEQWKALDRGERLAIGQELGADRVININDEDAVEVVKQLTGGIGADYVVECAGTEATLNQAIHMTNRGGRICLAAFPHESANLDIAHLVKNNIYAYGIRGEGRSATRRAMALMAEKRFDATRIHTHTFPLADLPTALRYARDRIDDAIKVVVTNRQAGVIASAAE